MDSRPHPWIEPLLSATGILGLVPFAHIAITLGPPPVAWTWGLCLIWCAGVALSGLTVRWGRRMGARQALAILPGLVVVRQMPREGAIPVLVLLGVVLLAAARSGRRRRCAHAGGSGASTSSS